MKRRLGIILMMVAVLVMTGVGAYAMPIRIEEGTFAATATTLADGETYELNTDAFQLMGRDADGTYLIYADEQILKVTRDELISVIDALGLPVMATLPNIVNYAPLSRGSKGEAVVNLQNALRALEYTSGSADGDFGGQSERAVSAFQEAMGLEETGVADEMTQLLILSLAEEEFVVAPVVDPAVRFAAIDGKTDADLTAVIDQGLSLKYDDVVGVGMISDGTVIEYEAPAESDIDKCALTLQFGLRVKQGADGAVDIAPVLAVESLSVRRPILQEVILKSGDERRTIAVGELKNALVGVQSQESADIALDADTVEMLANAAEEGELKIRVNCKYGAYDIEVPAENLASVSSVAIAAQGL